MLISCGPAVFGRVGFRGDDIDNVFERVRPPRIFPQVEDGPEPSEVYECDRERGARGTVSKSVDNDFSDNFGTSSLGGSASGPGIGSSFTAAYS